MGTKGPHGPGSRCDDSFQKALVNLLVTASIDEVTIVGAEWHTRFHRASQHARFQRHVIALANTPRRRGFPRVSRCPTGKGRLATSTSLYHRRASRFSMNRIDNPSIMLMLRRNPLTSELPFRWRIGFRWNPFHCPTSGLHWQDRPARFRPFRRADDLEPASIRGFRIPWGMEDTC